MKRKNHRKDKAVKKSKVKKPRAESKVKMAECKCGQLMKPGYSHCA